MKKALKFFGFVVLFMSLSFPAFAGEVLTYKAEITNYPGTVVLRSYVPALPDSDREVFFEWGEDRSVPFQTEGKTVSFFFPSSGNYYYVLSNLKTNKTHYYRVVVKEEDGSVWRGPMQTFVTLVRSGDTYTNTSQGGLLIGANVTKNTNTADVTTVATGGENKNGGSVSSSSGNGSGGFWASLFGVTKKESATTTSDTAVVTSTEQNTSSGKTLSASYQSVLSVAKWVVLALVIFLTVALFVYASSLYEQVKKAKQKKKEEEFLDFAPENLPLA